MKLLAVTGEAITAQALRKALPGDVDPGTVEVLVVAPALQDSPVKFWVSDADEAIARATDVQRRSVEEAEQAGVSASGDTGESDPMLAIEDALQTFPADRIVLFASEEAGHHRGDVSPQDVQERFGLPVTQAAV